MQGGLTGIDESQAEGKTLIGGFFALETAANPPAESVLALWGADPRLARDSAGAAFGALARALAPARIWLPGWLCRPFAEGLPGDRLRLYRVTPALAPDIASLADLAPDVAGSDWADRAEGRVELVGPLDSRPV